MAPAIPYTIMRLIKGHTLLMKPILIDMQESKDYGPDPFALNIEKATKMNDAFRSTLWTGENFRLH